MSPLTAEQVRAVVDIDEPRPAVRFAALAGRRFAHLLDAKLRPIDAVPGPFDAWNRACCDAGGGVGLARGWDVIVAARTGTGKSVLGLNIARAAVAHGERACLVSLEMDQVQLETRYLAIASGQPVRKLEQGRSFCRETFDRACDDVASVTERTGGLFWSNERPIRGLSSVLDAIRFNHEVHGCRFFVVDYIQLAGNPNDPESITEVSHAVRGLTQELQVATVAISQFNRGTSQPRERPTVFGLMGGSALENDADQVVLLDHSRMGRLAAPGEGWTTYAMLDKNRHGPLADIPVVFDATTLRIRERWPDEDPSGWVQ